MKRNSITVTIVITILMMFSVTAFADDKPNDTWVPCDGYAYAQTSTQLADSVYLSHNFSWDSDARLSGLKDDNNETLEMDIVFYNYDLNAFGEFWYYYDEDNGHRGVYWETNQPRPYWDTQASDDYYERNFSVGSSDANLFQKDTTYFWWGYATENSEGSMAKVVAQRGYRLITTIYEDTWNVFSEESVKLVEFSDWNAPSGKSWTY